MAKQPKAKLADQAGKKKQREPMTREERRAKAKTKNEEPKRDRVAALQIAPGLTYHQLENPSLHRKPATTANFEKDFLEALASSLDKKLEINNSPSSAVVAQVHESAMTEEHEEEAIFQIALRQVVTNEISSLFFTTQPLFDGLRDSPELAEAVAAVLFEEGGPMANRLAEILIADQPANAIADLLEEVGSKVYEFQLVAGALRPDYELERSARLGLIEPDDAERLKEMTKKEAARVGLQRRLSDILAGGGAIDPAMAGLISEGEQQAAAERQRRAQFRKKLAHGLRERKQKEGRRFSSSPEESGDEEFIKFLTGNRGDLGAVLPNLPIHLREQVTNLLRDEERKTPILRRIAAIKSVAQRRWVAIQARLQASADRPEEAVVNSIRAIRILREQLAQIRELGIELKKLDEPDKPREAADYDAAAVYRTWSDKGGPQPTWTLAQAAVA